MSDVKTRVYLTRMSEVAEHECLTSDHVFTEYEYPEVEHVFVV